MVAKTRAEIGSRGRAFLSCLAYPKYGTTAVISCADAPLAASIASMRRVQASEVFVGCIRNTFLPRRFSRNCTWCSPSAKVLQDILPSVIPSLADMDWASGSLPPRLKTSEFIARSIPSAQVVEAVAERVHSDPAAEPECPHTPVRA